MVDRPCRGRGPHRGMRCRRVRLPQQAAGSIGTCRQSLAEFSSARKAVLDTSENGSELQKLIRGALGVNDIIDAFADAATSAENTVDTEGCKAEATITQLNLVAKTLDSATDSLNASLKSIQEKNAETALQDPKPIRMARQLDNRPITHPGNRTEPLRTALLRTVPPTRNRWMNPKRNCNSRSTRQTNWSTNSARTIP